MKKITLIILMLLAFSINANAQYRLGSPVEATWDYTLADVTAGLVTRFEVRLNSGAWVNTGLPPTATSYVYVLPAIGLTVGTHTVSVRACSAVPECNLPIAATTITFTVISPIPKPPTNFKVQPGTTLVSNERIFEIVNSYSLIVRAEPIRDNELIQLAQNYKGPIPPTFDAIMDYLDATLLILGK